MLKSEQLYNEEHRRWNREHVRWLEELEIWERENESTKETLRRLECRLLQQTERYSRHRQIMLGLEQSLHQAAHVGVVEPARQTELRRRQAAAELEHRSLGSQHLAVLEAVARLQALLDQQELN